MPRKSTRHERGSTDRPPSERELAALVARMTCACADCAADEDAPLARAMFHLVESRRQRPDAAARALGIAAGDGAYLLAGLRQDLAVDLVVALLAGRIPNRTDHSRGQGS